MTCESFGQYRLGYRLRLKAVALVLLLAVPAGALLTGALLAGAAAAAGKITVTGQGMVPAAPDMATIMLGATSQAETAQGAMAGNSAAVAAILAQLKAAGIEDRDIQTSGLSLNPQFDYNKASDGTMPEILGYIASNNVTVRVRALDGLGLVLDSVIANGANTFNGLTFGLASPEPVMDAARKLAVADARRKAELYAAAAGVRLGQVLTIAENGGYSEPQPMFRMAADSAEAQAVPVASGEIGVTATVTIEFEVTE